jgi:uncharacterized iron-regulated membrane protein
VLVDAGTNALTASPPLPWYLTALLVSQPLHFGDYGGLPMQIIWALLDIATIVVLGSGLYLWIKRRNPAPAMKPAPRPGTQQIRMPFPPRRRAVPHERAGGFRVLALVALAPRAGTAKRQRPVGGAGLRRLG